ncbi:30S ribosomal protein S8 [Candidatus Microgenomates bacterium]|nr:30S ribosomal protein S8 [Candidatus Microgenomates bacterium]
MVTYQVGDFLIRIKNSAKAKKREVSTETSKAKLAVAKVLKKEGFLSEVSEKDGKLNVTLAYAHKEPVLMNLKLVSKPGLRIYVKSTDIADHKGGSIFVVSTPRGVVSSKEALKLGNGGELIAEVW